jgi:hypothetical protein
MKTAMQELIYFLEPELKMGDFLQLPAYEKAKSLLEKEKQQIIDAAKHGVNFNESPFANAEQYYNETFNS